VFDISVGLFVCLLSSWRDVVTRQLRAAEKAAYLDEANIGGLLAEALTADVEAVLADQTSLVGADAAVGFQKFFVSICVSLSFSRPCFPFVFFFSPSPSSSPGPSLHRHHLQGNWGMSYQAREPLP
jgi:hypothetical protein